MQLKEIFVVVISKIICYILTFDFLRPWIRNPNLYPEDTWIRIRNTGKNTADAGIFYFRSAGPDRFPNLQAG